MPADDEDLAGSSREAAADVEAAAKAKVQSGNAEVPAPAADVAGASREAADAGPSEKEELRLSATRTVQLQDGHRKQQTLVHALARSQCQRPRQKSMGPAGPCFRQAPIRRPKSHC